jgi:uncharacterized protein (TIGR03437 family)
MKLSVLLLISASLVLAQPQPSAEEAARGSARQSNFAAARGEAAQTQMGRVQRMAPVNRAPATNRQAPNANNEASATASLVPAQPQFSTGQAARLVIGQPRFASQRSETAQSLVGAAQGVAFSSGTLLVADSNRQGAFPNNQRVLVYRDIASHIPNPHDEIIQNGTPCPICLGYAPGTPPPAGTPWQGASAVVGQPDFVSFLPNQSTILNSAPTALTMRFPVSVAYNGTVVAVADAENNRVLIWNSLPLNNDQPADFVVGQPDFTSYTSGKYGLYGYPHGHSSATSLRAPSGVFLDAANGLWVADTGNDRVLFYGVITGNGQSAKLVLGQTNFALNAQSIYTLNTTASTLFAPASVSSDGQHLFVADNYQNRVLIWNSIPTSTGQPADVVVGQKDFASNFSNTLSATVDAKSVTVAHSDLCVSNGTDTTTETGTTLLLYPGRCAGTLSAPMAAISDGTRLFIADSGNDRVLVYNHIPTQYGAAADVILGQVDEFVDNSSDSNAPQGVASADSFKSPNSLAWDGTNLYVADTFNRRIAVYTPGDFQLPVAAVRNAASPFVYAQGTVAVSGTPEDNDTLTVTIGNNTILNSTGTVITVGYSYAEKASNTIADVVNGLANAINSSNSGAGDPYVTAIPNPLAAALILKAKAADLTGNEVTLAASTSLTSPKTTLTPSGSTLAGGQDSALMAPFALVRISGGKDQNIVQLDASKLPPVQPLNKPLPTSLGGVEFYVDGIKCPMVAVTKTSFVAQMPIELAFAMEPETLAPDPSTTVNVTDTIRFPRTASGIVRVTNQDGSVQVSSAIHIPVIQQNPSIFYDPASQPNPGGAFHFSSQATATISVDGSIQGGDQATVTIRDRIYTYTVQPSDALVAVRDALIAIINASDPEVQASASGPFARIRLKAFVPGPIGNGIPIGTSATSTSTLSSTVTTLATAKIIMTAFNSQLCCANIAGAPITTDNPATPGETISVFASGLGRLKDTNDFVSMINGKPFNGSDTNNVTDDGFVYGLVGSKSANILFSGLKVGYVGIYQIDMELNSSLTTDPKTTLTLSQLNQTSNIVSIPVVATAPSN